MRLSSVLALAFLLLFHAANAELTVAHEFFPAGASLYIGDANDAADAESLRSHKIARVINLTKKPNTLEGDGVEYMRYPVNEIFDKEETSFGFIDESIIKGDSVLIHCYKGCKGASAATIAYLMRKNGLTRRATHMQIEQVRPCAAEILEPANEHLLSGLDRLELLLKREL